MVWSLISRMIRRLSAPWASRTLFAAGLGYWLWGSIHRLPFGCSDVRFPIWLTFDCFVPVEFAHPAFLSFLKAFQFVLGTFRYVGNMLLPVEIFNLAVGLLTAVLLFQLTEHVFRDSLSAAVSTLLLAFSRGFWAGAMRPDPYALAALLVSVTVAILVRPMRRGTYLLAGLTAGLAAGFDIAALALLPVAAVAAWQERKTRGHAAREVGHFAAAMGIALAVAFAVLAVYHGFVPAWNPPKAGWMFVLVKIVEQQPLSSVYTNHDLAQQAAGYWNTARNQGFFPWLAGSLIAIPAGLLVRRRTARLEPDQSRALGIAAAAFASLTGFFLINNNQNTFIYSAVLPAPLALTALFSRLGVVRSLVLPLALMTSVPGIRSIARAPDRDPLLMESLFLSASLRGRGILLVPGQSFQEIRFLRPVKILNLPDLDFDDVQRQISAALRSGGPVWFATGDLERHDPSRKDLGGELRYLQSFSVRNLERGREDVAYFQRKLSAAFLMDCTMASPQGWRYCRLSQQRKGQRTQPASSAWRPEIPPAERRNLADAVRAHAPDEPSDFHSQLLSLLDWLAEAPEDAYVQSHLVSLLDRRNRLTRPERDAARSSFAQAAAACAELQAGRDTRALARWSAALGTCADCLRRGLLLQAPAARDASTLRQACAEASWYGPLVRWSLSQLDAPRADLRMDPQRQAVLEILAAGKFAQSLKLLDALVMRKPKVAAYHNDRGCLLLRMGRGRQAELDLRAAISLDPDYVDPYLSLGTGLVAEGRAAEAVRLYDQALANPRLTGGSTALRLLEDGRDKAMTRTEAAH